MPHPRHPAQRGAVVIGHADLIDTTGGMIDRGERQARLRGTRNDRPIAQPLVGKRAIAIRCHIQRQARHPQTHKWRGRMRRDRRRGA